MERTMAVLDSDSLYVTRFMEYIKNRKEYDFEIMVFTRLSSLEEYLHYNKLEILLVGEGFQPEEIQYENIKYIYTLNEKPGRKNTADFPSIFKFRQAKEILSEIISDYLIKENNTVEVKGNLNVSFISIFSPCPDADKFNFAWSFAMSLSERKKVMFIPLLSFLIPVIQEMEGPSQALSEIIFYLKENDSNFILKMNALLRYHGNLSYLFGLTHGFDLLSLTKEDIAKWLEELKLNTDYEAVVFFIGFYSDSCMELIRKSNQVIIPIKDDRYEQVVIKDWERQTELIGIDVYKETFKKLYLPMEEDIQSITDLLSN